MITSWLWAIVLRVVFLAAAFDIYFTSPLIKYGSPDAQVLPLSPANRLVLFVADGFRASSFLKTDNAPYLKSIIKNRGSWGISHTHIPTESRPGHVAIIAGFYEDPSAVAKGWKENPIEFDSVFNQSRYTWSWGSPDILPMFAKGATGDHVFTHFYSHKEEDFSGKKSTANLDTWVFNKVEDFFKDAASNADIVDKLHHNKLIFFLHLLGLDTAGHTHKPHSNLYEENIRVVDTGIAKMESIIEQYYGFDNRTAYIFTADHGMTDWGRFPIGSHGAGSDDETKTPFIAWGAGITYGINNDKMEDINDLRDDMSQADICPLMASLIGINIPEDSVGILPDSYLNVSEINKVQWMCANMRQILTQYNKKRKSIEDKAIKILYKPFKNLTENIINDIKILTEKLLLRGELQEAKNMCKETINLSLIGLDYYQNYYQSILLWCMTFSYFGWIFWLLTTLLKDVEKTSYLNHSTHRKTEMYKYINISFGFSSLVLLLLIFLQNLPIQYNIYCLLPIFLWWRVSLEWNLWYTYFKNLTKHFKSSLLGCVFKLVINIAIYAFGSLALIFSFFDRRALSIAVFGVMIFPFKKSYRQHISTVVLILWFLSCLSIVGFSFLPVVGKNENIHLVGVSALLWFFTAIIFLFKFSLSMLKNHMETKKENAIMVLPPIMMIIAIQNKYFVEYQFNKQQGLSMFSQIISWMLAVFSFIIPTFSSRWVLSRLFCIHSSLAIVFLLLSVSHEGLFLYILCINLFCWLSIEHYSTGMQGDLKLSQLSFNIGRNITKDKLTDFDRTLDSDDFRRSFIFLLYIILSFFGTGNIASINSFDPQWIRCFIAQFSPFMMAALILSKTLMPFICVICIFCAVNRTVKAPVERLFVIVLIFSDFMGLFFLHMITNKGSWLEIGTSISHYVIIESIVFFVSLLYGFGQYWTSVSAWSCTIFENKTRLKTY